jgi:hypothetical protein
LFNGTVRYSTCYEYTAASFLSSFTLFPEQNLLVLVGRVTPALGSTPLIERSELVNPFTSGMVVLFLNATDSNKIYVDVFSSSNEVCSLPLILFLVRLLYVPLVTFFLPRPLSYLDGDQQPHLSLFLHGQSVALRSDQFSKFLWCQKITPLSAVSH